MTKRVIPAWCASRTIAGLPTMSRTRVAAMLSDRRIIGDSSALSAPSSGRSRTLACRR
jgi:hypothetical protein